MFIASLFMTVKDSNNYNAYQLKSRLTNCGIPIQQDTNYSAIKWKEQRTYETAQLNLKTIMLNKEARHKRGNLA